MRVGRPVLPFVLSPSERDTLERHTRRATTAQALALRARIILRCARGETHTGIAAALGVALPTVGKWRKRFVEQRVAGLLDEPRPGAPRRIRYAAIEDVLIQTLETTPPDATHWSTRSLAKRVGLSQSTVARVWKSLRVAAASDRNLEAVERPVVHRQSPRHRRALSASAGSGPRALRR